MTTVSLCHCPSLLRREHPLPDRRHRSACASRRDRHAGSAHGSFRVPAPLADGIGRRRESSGRLAHAAPSAPAAARRPLRLPRQLGFAGGGCRLGFGAASAAAAAASRHPIAACARCRRRSSAAACSASSAFASACATMCVDLLGGQLAHLHQGVGLDDRQVVVGQEAFADQLLGQVFGRPLRARRSRPRPARSARRAPRGS